MYYLSVSLSSGSLRIVRKQNDTIETLLCFEILFLSPVSRLNGDNITRENKRARDAGSQKLISDVKWLWFWINICAAGQSFSFLKYFEKSKPLINESRATFPSGRFYLENQIEWPLRAVRFFRELAKLDVDAKHSETEMFPGACPINFFLLRRTEA